MEVEVKTITPAVAKAMLEKNTGNRSIRQGHVDMIARDMLNGEWKMNGDAIRLNGDGTLLDGQHRLAACVKSGVPFKSLVVSGLETSVRLTIDAGSRRTAGDQMGFHGIKSANTIAAACRYAMIFREGKWASQSYTNAEIMNFYEENGGISNWVKLVTGGPRGGASMATAAAYVIEQSAGPKTARGFAHMWTTGSAAEGSPILALREKVIRAQMAGKPLSTKDKLNSFGWAIAKYVKGESAKNIRQPKSFYIPGWSE